MGVWAEWLFYYTVYGFGGWLLENVYSRVTARRFWKEGFLFSPIKPMYGFAVITVLAAKESGGSLLFLLVCCLLIPSGIEFASGFLLDKGFGKRYWDYRGMRGSVRGYVCMAFSLCWFPLMLGALYGLHPAVHTMYEGIAGLWNPAALWIGIAMLVEVVAAAMILRRKQTRGLLGWRMKQDKERAWISERTRPAVEEKENLLEPAVNQVGDPGPEGSLA